MLRTFRWTLLAFMALASLPAPSRDEDATFSAGPRVGRTRGPIDAPRILRVHQADERKARPSLLDTAGCQDRRVR